MDDRRNRSTCARLIASHVPRRNRRGPRGSTPLWCNTKPLSTDGLGRLKLLHHLGVGAAVAVRPRSRAGCQSHRDWRHSSATVGSLLLCLAYPALGPDRSVRAPPNQDRCGARQARLPCQVVGARAVDECALSSRLRLSQASVDTKQPGASRRIRRSDVTHQFGSVVRYSGPVSRFGDRARAWPGSRSAVNGRWRRMPSTSPSRRAPRNSGRGCKPAPWTLPWMRSGWRRGSPGGRPDKPRPTPGAQRRLIA